MPDPALVPESESSLRRRVFVVFALLTVIIGSLFISEGYYAAVDFGRRMEQEAFDTSTGELANHLQKSHAHALPPNFDNHITTDSALWLLRDGQRSLLANRLVGNLDELMPSATLDEIQRRALSDRHGEAPTMQEHLLVVDDHEFTWSSHPVEPHGTLMAIKRLATPRLAWKAVLVRLATSSIVILWIGFWAAFGVALFVAKRVANSNRAIVRAANVDTMTELPNQNVLITELEQAATTDHPITLIMMSVVNLPLFEQTYGNRTRLALVAQIGNKIAERMAGYEDAVSGRYDGNVFFILLKHTAIVEARDIAQRLIAHFNEPVVEGAASLLPSLALGIAVNDAPGEPPLDIITHAMLAVRSAEEQRTQVRVYSHDMDSLSRQKIRRSAELMRALTSHEFILLYQPKIRLSDGGIVGVEALVRWDHPEEGRLSPAEFLDLIETSSIARHFTRYVIDRALEQVRRWHDDGLLVPVAINLSPYDLADDALLSHIETRLESAVFPRHLIEFELTETATTIDVGKTSAAFRRLESLGLARSIDDFGTGMSSLSYLRQIPFTTVKIDRAFIRDISTDPTSQAIVESVLAMADKIGWSVVAEGIETPDIAARLSDMGCRYGQGFLFAKPVSGEDIAAMMRRSSTGSIAPLA